MPRGGHRPGAGRKRALSSREELGAGARCERLWREAAEEAASAEIERRHESVREEWEEARRRRELGEPLPDDHSELVAMALAQDQGLSDDATPAHVMRFPIKRPKGRRERIIAQVAAEYGVTPRRIRTAWERFREVQKRLDTDDV